MDMLRCSIDRDRRITNKEWSAELNFKYLSGRNLTKYLSDSSNLCVFFSPDP